MDDCYLDYAGSGLPSETIMARYAEYAREFSLNPHSGTRQAEVARRKVLEAERRILSLLGIREGEARVIWTSGATEALNLGIRGYGEQNCMVCVDAAAHPAMLEACRCRENCVELAPGKLSESLPDGCEVLCVCHVNNETGAIADLMSLRKGLDQVGGKSRCFVVDCAQSFCRQAIPWRSCGIDLLSLSSRKIGGPAGVGALVVRRGVALRPLIVGGGQQSDLRSGTLDVVGISLFADAAEEASQSLAQAEARIRHLNEGLWRGLEAFSDCGLIRISPTDGSAHIATFSLVGYEGAVVKRILADRYGILVGSGSACSAEAGKPSHVLTAMGYDESVSRGAIRVSFGPTSRQEDVDRFLVALKSCLDEY